VTLVPKWERGSVASENVDGGVAESLINTWPKTPKKPSAPGHGAGRAGAHIWTLVCGGLMKAPFTPVEKSRRTRQTPLLLRLEARSRSRRYRFLARRLVTRTRQYGTLPAMNSLRESSASVTGGRSG